MFKRITNVKILTNKIKDVKVLHCPYTLVFPISVKHEDPKVSFHLNWTTYDDFDFILGFVEHQFYYLHRSCFVKAEINIS